MDRVSFEVLQNIFQRLPQKYVPICSTVCRRWHDVIQTSVMYSTVTLYSMQQLNTFMDASKKLYVKDKPVTYYIRHLIIYFDSFYFINNYVDILRDMINIQTIDIRSAWYGNKINEPFPQLDQLIHRPRWYKGSENQLSKLKSLEYNFFHDGNGQLLHDYIYLKYLNEKTLSSSSSSPVIDHPREILILPSPSSIKNLTYLYIRFPFKQMRLHRYDLDERMFELIHQSCSQLLKLKLDNFYMYISEEYDTLLYNDIKKLTPAHSLKEMELECTLMDPKCFLYLSLKYPYMESFTYFMPLYEIQRNHLQQHFGLAFYEMITKYSHLKRFSFETACDIDSVQYDLFPQHNFIQWLNNNPKQLDHISYPFYFMQDGTEPSYDNTLEQPSSTSILFNIIQYGTFLNHLSSLTIDGIYLLFNIRDYLLLNENSLSVSNSINELKIHRAPKFSSPNDIQFINLFNYLDVFPNLTIFEINDISIKDYSYNDNNNDEVEEDEDYYYDSDNDNDNDDDSEDNVIDNYINYDEHTSYHSDKMNKDLQKLIKTRKYLLGKNLDEEYKLKELILNDTKIRITKDLDLFFNRFSHLNKLVFSNTSYSYQSWENEYDDDDELPYVDDVLLYMNHLSLKSILITGFIPQPWKHGYPILYHMEAVGAAEISTINERSPFKTYTIYSHNTIDPDEETKRVIYESQFNIRPVRRYTPYKCRLTISCKNLDEILFY